MQSNSRFEEWQTALTEEWLIQIEIDGGAMSLDLDRFLSEASKEALVISSAESALNKTDDIGRRTGELFLELLRGRLKTNESSPIDYSYAYRVTLL